MIYSCVRWLRLCQDEEQSCSPTPTENLGVFGSFKDVLHGCIFPFVVSWPCLCEVGPCVSCLCERSLLFGHARCAMSYQYLRFIHKALSIFRWIRKNDRHRPLNEQGELQSRVLRSKPWTHDLSKIIKSGCNRDIPEISLSKAK
jgi:hypothetical protein